MFHPQSQSHVISAYITRIAKKCGCIVPQEGGKVEQMSDLIERQAAIDFIDAGHLVNGNEPRWSDHDVVNFLKSRPSAEPGWIPCAERLPEASGAYLVTCANGNVRVGHFATFDGKWTDAKAVAWMPLPEAYEG